MTYGQFAYVYDQLMDHAPYDDWVQFTEDIIAHFHMNPSTIVDLGCGTGEIAVRLAKKGYDVTGVDLSSHMLTVAYEKSIQAKQQVNWIQQDITMLAGFSNIDLFISYCDVMNYITNVADVEKVFHHVFNSLRDGGAFIFDLHALPYAENILMDETFTLVTDDLSYIWQCEQGKEEGAMEHYLTFFRREGDLYQRFDEVHYQRTHPIQFYKRSLKNIGFRKIKFYTDFSIKNEIYTDIGERIFVFAEK